MFYSSAKFKNMKRPTQSLLVYYFYFIVEQISLFYSTWIFIIFLCQGLAMAQIFDMWVKYLFGFWMKYFFKLLNCFLKITKNK